MSENSIHNKRIAKNTLMLYIRMLFIMVVSLYTSRVVLNTLGVTDFGIYNIIASVIVLFSFLNSAMMTSSQRFLNFALGKGNMQEVQNVFSASLTVFFILAFVVFALAESIGFWFISTKISIPADRYDTAMIVYHISIITTCVNIIRIPYNASIIAYEKMSFYAYNSILEAVLKLLIVWLLTLSYFDKLISYSILLLAVTIIINISYIVYCKANIVTTKFSFSKDRSLLKKISVFSIWNLIGGIADVGYTQGTNIILNLFHGVALNATMGISNQIKSAVYSFVRNLQSAANPQIIKSYASGDINQFYTLFFNISKYSFYLMLMLALPILLNVDYILKIWLINPPAYSSIFVSLTIIFCCLDSLVGPLWVIMQAHGDIKTYQIITNFIVLLNVPLSYYALVIKLPPYYILIIQICLCVVSIFIRLYISRIYVKLSLSQYFFDVIKPIALVLLISIPVPFFVSLYLDNLAKLIVVVFLSFLSIILAVYSVGVKESERIVIKQLIKKKI